MKKSEWESLWITFKPTIKYVCYKYAGFIKDGVHDEGALEQEGFSIMRKALRHYDFRDVAFKTYFTICLENHFKNLLRSWNYDRKLMVRGIDNPEQNDRSENPESSFYVEEIKEKVIRKLRPFDRDVFTCMMDESENGGSKADRIALKVGGSYHQVIRSIQRIKKEVRLTMASTI